MRFMIIVKTTNASESGVMPEEKLVPDMANWREELVKAGVSAMVSPAARQIVTP